MLAFLMIAGISGCSVQREQEIIEGGAALIPSASGSTSSAFENSLAEVSSPEKPSLSSSEQSSFTSASDEQSSISESESSSVSSSSESLSSEEISSTSEVISEGSSETSSEPEETYAPAPSGETRAVWISYLEYQTILQGKTKKQFTSNISNMFANLVSDGFNTVFVHVRSHSDAVYDSDIFPWSVYCTGKEGADPGFDPLEIMVYEAHAAGLEIEAWINPYRIKGNSDISKISAESPAYKWLGTDKVIVLENGIFYNPADEEVIDLVVSGVLEIVRKYDIDGVHFDDYFYPSIAQSIDNNHYNNYKNGGGTLGLSAWRRQNVNTLIRRVYSAIKNEDPSCRFGISPTGNMSSNYSELYCDVYTWVTSKGYIDYICPQLYYGFNNQSKPYLDVLYEFNDMITNSNVELIIGLAAYKCGAVDNFAGSGKNEWMEYSDILSRQISSARGQSRYSGFSLYRYDSVYNPAAGVRTAVDEEISGLKDIL